MKFLLVVSAVLAVAAAAEVTSTSSYSEQLKLFMGLTES